MGNSCERERKSDRVRALICTDETGLNQHKAESLVKILVKKYGSPDMIYTSPTPSARKLAEELVMMLPMDVKIDTEEELVGRHEPWLSFASRVENIIFSFRSGVTWYITHDTILEEVIRKYKSWSIDRNDLNVTVKALDVAILQDSWDIEYIS